MSELVSIIIPTYNRAHLIGQTLDSVLAQTYQNWECIVVDDSSTDHTEEVISNYLKQDLRFQYHSRPDDRPKGANACRNYGFELSKGSYIIWFDSDDLMTFNHIESKLKSIQDKNLDFIIARTQNFKNCHEMLEPYNYEIKNHGIKASDFILLKIHWYTYDILLRRNIGEKIRWNEKMKSWQDYNYFCKMLLLTENGNYLNEILTYRRIHDNSIQKFLNQSTCVFNNELLENRILTFKDISENIDAKTQNELIFGMMNLCFEIAKNNDNSLKLREVESIVKYYLGLRSAILFNLSLISSRFTNKGYYFLNKAKNK
jgi:glycosyltransferase involved in cell wall biosynthesis